MGKLTIGVRVTESMIRSGLFTIQMTVVGSRRNRKNMKTGRLNPMMIPTMETRMITSLGGVL